MSSEELEVSEESSERLWRQVTTSVANGVSNLIHAAKEGFRHLSNRAESSDEPLIFLGRRYSGAQDPAFLDDFSSRIWLTYRMGFPPIRPSTYTTDVGWGCMLRSGQCLVANAFVIHFLSREWRLEANKDPKVFNTYVKILSLFLDSNSSPYSIHRIALLGSQFGKEVGEWFGPSTIANVFKLLNKKDRDISIYVATDGVIYIDEVHSVCMGTTDEDGRLGEWRPLIILIPVRLGLDHLNPVYFNLIKDCLTLSYCVGIAGGRPNSSLYFLGFQNDNLIYLDPHYVRTAVELKDYSSYTLEELASYSCETVRFINIASLDPSMVIGFCCKDKASFMAFLNEAEKLCSGKTPLFSIQANTPEYHEAEILSDAESF